MIVKIFIFSILIVILILIIFFAIKSTETPDYYKGSITKHFNGKNFYNPEPYKKKTTLDLLRWLLNRKRAEWPQAIENPIQPFLTVMINPNKGIATLFN